MRIRPLRKDISEYLTKHNLRKKFSKSALLFENDIRHPSLNCELLEPARRGIYSFRIDRKYRALFFIEGNEAEIISVTNHYKN